ncbi:MAG TPA: GntR family transcriptional regulator [Thermovirgaceae bacterium]|jgi:DNA-binding GntR family transcriptional regulator|nr:GntR family transcriptional regulator [Thermovirgaceae bacterium]
MKAHKEEIYRVLRNRIIGLDYKPGEVLSDRDLVAGFGTSRTPVREAILKLQKDGLVETVPRVGTFVASIDIKSVRHAYEMKKNLEGLAAELAASRAGEEQIRGLLDLAGAFAGLDNFRDYRECIEKDSRFHELTHEASGNPLLMKTLENLSLITVRFLQHIQYVENEYEWYKDSINAIAEAIRRRDPAKARKEAEQHTAAFLTKLASYFFG